MRVLVFLLAILVASALAACGGGGGDSNQFTVAVPQEEPVILRDSTGLLELALGAGTVST